MPTMRSFEELDKIAREYLPDDWQGPQSFSSGGSAAPSEAAPRSAGARIRPIEELDAIAREYLPDDWQGHHFHGRIGNDDASNKDGLRPWAGDMLRLGVRGATSEGLLMAGEGLARLGANTGVDAAARAARLAARPSVAAREWAADKLGETAWGRQLRRDQEAQRKAARWVKGKAKRGLAKSADKLGEWREGLREALPVSDENAESLLGQIAQGLGQAAGTLPLFAVPVAGHALGMASAVGQLYQEGYDDALAHTGGDAQKAHDAGLKNVPAAALEYLGDRFVVSKILKPLVGKVTVGQVLKAAGASALSEGLTEGAQQGWQNVVARWLSGYDPNRKLDQDVMNAVIVGAAVGGIAGGGGVAAKGGLAEAFPVRAPDGRTSDGGAADLSRVDRDNAAIQKQLEVIDSAKAAGQGDGGAGGPLDLDALLGRADAEQQELEAREQARRAGLAPVADGVDFSQESGRADGQASHNEQRLESNPTTDRPDPFTGERSFITGSRVSAEQAEGIARRVRATFAGIAKPNAAGALGVAQAQLRDGQKVLPLARNPEGVLLNTQTGQSLPEIGRGVEAYVYEDAAQGVVYKVYQIGRSSDQSIGMKLAIDEGVAGLDTGQFPDVVEKTWVINELGGTPTEIVGLTENGEIVVKQPRGNDAARYARAQVIAKAHLQEIPAEVLPRMDMRSALYYARIDGRDVLLGDLHARNFIGDTIGAGRINDLATHVLTEEELRTVPKLAEWIEAHRAQAEARGAASFALGQDRSASQERSSTDSLRSEGERSRAMEAASSREERVAAVEELVAFLRGRAVSRPFEISEKRKTLADAIVAGETTVQAAQEALDEAKARGQLDEGVTFETAEIRGESRRAGGADARLAVYEFVNRLNEGADPTSVLEEASETYLKLALERGVIALGDVAAWKRSVDAALAKEGSPPEGKSYSERELIEWFSDQAQAYFLGKSDGGSIPAKVRAWLDRVREYLARVFDLAAQLMRLEAEGRLDKGFQRALREAVGLDAELAGALASDAHAAAIARGEASGVGPYQGKFLSRTRPNEVSVTQGGKPLGGTYQLVWHGSPHRGIEREGFKTEKINTGEGAQAYGWGIYFAEKKGVAEGYRQRLSRYHLSVDDMWERVSYKGRRLTKDYRRELSESGTPAQQWLTRLYDFDEHTTSEDAFERVQEAERSARDMIERYNKDILDGVLSEQGRNLLPRYQERLRFAQEILPDLKSSRQLGQLYQVEIPEVGELLDWDRAFNDQPERVQAALRQIWSAPQIRRSQGMLRQDVNGEWFYTRLAEALGGDGDSRRGGAERASRLLQKHGIPGLRYLDGVSRGDGEGTHNFVIWDESRLGPEVAKIGTTYQLRVRRDLSVRQRGLDKAGAQRALAKLRGKPLLNEATGALAYINTKQAGKLVSEDAVHKSTGNGFTREQHYGLVAHIKRLWRHALPIYQHPDERGGDGKTVIKRFAVPVQVGEQVRYATILAKESFEHGHRIYTLEALKEETLRSILDKPVTKDGTALTPFRSVEETFRELQAILKPKDQEATYQLRSAADEEPHDGSKGSPEGYLRLFHVGHEGVTEILDVDTKVNGYDGGRFGGLFALSEPRMHDGGPVDYYMDVPLDKIADSFKLSYESDWEVIEPVLRREYERADLEGIYDFETWTDWVLSEDRPESDTYDKYGELIREVPASVYGEADWDAQRARGQVAKAMGYQAVEMSDEHGTSYLVLPGVVVRPMQDDTATYQLRSAPEQLRDDAGVLLGAPSRFLTTAPELDFRARVERVAPQLMLQYRGLVGDPQLLLEMGASPKDLETSPEQAAGLARQRERILWFLQRNLRADKRGLMPEALRGQIVDVATQAWLLAQPPDRKVALRDHWKGDGELRGAKGRSPDWVKYWAYLLRHENASMVSDARSSGAGGRGFMPQVAAEFRSFLEEAIELLGRIFTRTKRYTIDFKKFLAGEDGDGGRLSGRGVVATSSGVTSSTAPEPVAVSVTQGGKSLGATYQLAWHGSPYKGIEKTGFKTNFIGTGEGAQAYGWGIYFAENKEVSEIYKDKLQPQWEVEDGLLYKGRELTSDYIAELREGGSEADKLLLEKLDDTKATSGGEFLYSLREQLEGLESDAEIFTDGDYTEELSQLNEVVENLEYFESMHDGGQLYQVELPENDELLDWDASFDEQPSGVQEALRKVWQEPRLSGAVEFGALSPLDEDITGEQIYKELEANLGGRSGGDLHASMILEKHGIPGLRYLDGNSRSIGYGTRNFVIWDDARLGPDVAKIQTTYQLRSAADAPANVKGQRPQRSGEGGGRVGSSSPVLGAYRSQGLTAGDGASNAGAADSRNGAVRHRGGADPLFAVSTRQVERAYGGREAYEAAKAAGGTNLSYGQWLQVRSPEFKAWFGDWQKLRAEKRLDAMEPVELQLDDKLKGASVPELREAVVKHLADLARAGVRANNPEVGEVGFANSKTGKIVSTSAAPEKLHATLDIVRVIEAAHLVGSEDSYKGKHAEHGVLYHTLATKVSAFGREFVAITTIEQAPTGSLFYNNIAVESGHKNAPVAYPRNSESGDSAITSAFTGAGQTKLGPLRRVNPESVSQAVDAQTGEPLVFYHGGKGDFTQLREGGRFGQMVFLREGQPADYRAATYPLFLRGKILEAEQLADALEGERGEVLLREHLRGREVSDEAVQEIINSVREQQHYPEEAAWDALGAVDEADAQVEYQGLLGKLARELGFDAVRIADEFDGETVAVVEPTAIKSAIGNRGTFDGSNPDITYQLRQLTAEERRLRALNELGELNYRIGQLEGREDLSGKEKSQLRQLLGERSDRHVLLGEAYPNWRSEHPELARGQVVDVRATRRRVLERDLKTAQRAVDRGEVGAERQVAQLQQSLKREFGADAAKGAGDAGVVSRSSMSDADSQPMAADIIAGIEDPLSATSSEGESTAAAAALIEGHSHVPEWKGKKEVNWLLSWLKGFRGTVPELPAMSDDITQRWAALKRFKKEVARATPRVWHETGQRIAAIARPLLEGVPIDAEKYRLLQQIQKQIRSLEESSTLSSGRASSERPSKTQQKLAELRGRVARLDSELESHPYVLFGKLVRYLDMDWRARNLKDSEGNPIAMPGGLTPEQVAAELERLKGLVRVHAHSERIVTALEAHMRLVKRIWDELKARDLTVGAQAANPYYYPHLVMGKEGAAGAKSLERVRLDTADVFRGYLVEPVGSVRPIETDYVKAMHAHVVAVDSHNTRADLVRDLVKGPYDIMPELQKKAKALSKQWGRPVSWSQVFNMDYAKQGWVRYVPDDRLHLHSEATVNRQKLAERLGVALGDGPLQEELKKLGIAGVELLPSDIKEAMVANEREVWIVPEEVAAALDGMIKREGKYDDMNPALRVLEGSQNLWKRNILFAPWNYIRYEYNNTVSDIEKLFSVDPGLFLKLPEALREVLPLFGGEGEASALAKIAMRLGVMQSVTVSELGKLPQLEQFAALKTTSMRAADIAKAASTLFLTGGRSTVELSQLREATFRYAKFKADVERMRNGARPVYGGAYWKDVEAIKVTQSDLAAIRGGTLSDGVGAGVQTLSEREARLLEFREFLDGPPIAENDGTQFQKADTPLEDRVAQWYADNHYSEITVPDVGTVLLDKKAVGRSIRHGLSRDKVAAFALVPDVLLGGKIIHTAPMEGSVGGVVHHVAAPVRMGGRDFIATVLLKSDQNVNRMYVHEVYVREGLQQFASKGSAVAATSEAGKRSATNGGAITTVLREIYSVKAPELGAGGIDPSIYLKAAEISLANFGDYNNISVSGQGLRKLMVPFYSWIEINFRYHANLFRNLKDMAAAGELSKAEAREAGTRAATVLAASFSRRVAARVLTRLLLPYVAVALWNNSDDRREMEEELSEADRRRFHIILGRDEKGRVMVVYGATALGDTMRWFGGDDLMRLSADLATGRTTLGTAIEDYTGKFLPDLANNLFGGVGPVIKVGLTLLSRRDFFPDVGKPRTIPAYELKWNILSQMTDGFTADMIRRVADKDYLAPRDMGDWVMQLSAKRRRRTARSAISKRISPKRKSWPLKLFVRRVPPPVETRLRLLAVPFITSEAAAGTGRTGHKHRAMSIPMYRVR